MFAKQIKHCSGNITNRYFIKLLFEAASPPNKMADKLFATPLCNGVNMKKMMFIFFIFISYLKCSDPQSTESNNPIINNNITVSGTIISNDSTSAISGLIIKLKGDSTYYDTTDNNGVFDFLIKSKGEYILSVIDSSYLPFDTTLNISNDTSITLKLSYLSPILFDYFPIEIGDKWTYEIEWTQCGDCDFYIEGKLKWEIIDLFENRDTTQIYIQEQVKTIQRKLLWMNDKWIWDTTYINQIDTFYYRKDGENYLTQQTDDYFSSYTEGKLKFMTMWSLDNKEEIVLKRYSWEKPCDGDLIILGGSTGQTVLKLKKGVGITLWQKMNDSNGDSKGSLSLIDYSILK